MVSLRNPDLARYPRFAEALAPSQSAELEPGDALFIPYGWWHHVESLTPFNVLVNYWWNDAPQTGSPYDVHAARRHDAARPAAGTARGVAHMFEHYVFTDPDESMAHLPPEQRGTARSALRRAHAGHPRRPGACLRPLR